MALEVAAAPLALDTGVDVDTASDCPPLPTEARVNPADGIGAGAWLDLYVNYAAKAAPLTPLAFHESAGLWLPSVAIARRLKAVMDFDTVYPNLFVAWIAPTTVWSKTTALNIAKNLARRTFPHLLAAQEATTEALLSDLAGAEPPHLQDQPESVRQQWELERNFAAQKGWLLDELSGLLASAGRDYNAGLVEALLRLFDCDERFTRSTRGQGRVVVRSAYLSLLGASTPLAMGSHLAGERLWAMGWWGRFALLTPETDYPDWTESVACLEPPDLAEHLRELNRRLPPAQWPDPPEAHTVTWDGEALDAWRRYTKAMRHTLLREADLDARLHASYGRLPVQAVKVATILAALDWPEQPEAPHIEYPHLARAVTIVEGWRRSAHRTLATVTASEFDAVCRRIIRLAAKAGDDGVTLRDLRRGIRDKQPDQLSDALRQLVEVGDLTLNANSNGSKMGRPTDRYSIPKRSDDDAN